MNLRIFDIFDFAFCFPFNSNLYKNSDIISLHCPLTSDTKYLINKDTISQMKKGVMIVNTGRGSLINTQDLINGLKSEKVGYAALDVYEEESEYFFEDYSSEILNDDIFVLGHYHSDQGIQIFKNSNKDQIFINVGAISRGTLTEEDTKREPKIGIVSVIKNENKISYKCNVAKLKVRPVDEVFDIVTHERTKKEKKEAQEFVEKVKTEI